MGNNRSDFKPGREQLNGSRLLVLDHPKLHNASNSKPSENRMESKVLMWLFTILPPTGYGLVFLLNVENVKGIVLFIIAVLYGCARLFFYIIKQNQERRLRELDILEKEKQLKL